MEVKSSLLSHFIYKFMNIQAKLSNTVKVIITILICEATGIFSAILSGPANNSWFDSLVKPEWNPPGYLFGPVWTVLYLLMGVSLGIIWCYKTNESNKKNAYSLFAFQLFLNFWWSIIFFNFHSPAFAFLTIVVMLMAILFTIISFSRFSKLAAWLLVPYIAWVSFASFLNLTIWNLNR